MIFLKGKVDLEKSKENIINPEVVKDKWKITSGQKKEISNMIIFRSIKNAPEIIIILFFDKYYSVRNNTLNEELKNFGTLLNVVWEEFRILNKNEAIEILQILSSNDYLRETLENPKSI
jgi:hypothetical protein